MAGSIYFPDCIKILWPSHPRHVSMTGSSHAEVQAAYFPEVLTTGQIGLLVNEQVIAEHPVVSAQRILQFIAKRQQSIRQLSLLHSTHWNRGISTSQSWCLMSLMPGSPPFLTGKLAPGLVVRAWRIIALPALDTCCAAAVSVSGFAMHPGPRNSSCLALRVLRS